MLDNDKYPLLSIIDSPQDLRQQDEADLPKLAQELRNYLIQTLNHCGGHFAASMGAIELTIALHYIFNTPKDQLIWDVGHQAYAHKVLTGRRDQLHTIKHPGGLAPFPKRDESEYDAFGVGHSSTSISAALGMAMAFKAQGSNNTAVAVIGDGGMTGGMAFEALNHAGSIDANLLVILNDNDMSISPNVGALNNYLTRILSGKAYNTLREGSKKVLAKVPPVKNLAKSTETHIKGMITPGTLFEELGFHYFGPIDGHDLSVLIPTLQNLQQLNGPRILHVATTKGKGFSAAESDPVKYHAVKAGYLEPKKTTTQTSNKTYSDIFGSWLCDMAAIEPTLIAITPAMREGSGMVQFAEKFPKQYVDVGIAEQHSVTLAAGLACEGMKPVVAIYSTFLQRAYDQLIHDVALQNLDVTFALDRAGLVGADGPTHAGSFDHSYLRCIPNMVVMAPSNENECRQMLTTAYHHPGPAAVRYPRGTGPGITTDSTLSALEIGKAQIKAHGHTVAILAFGTMVTPAEIAAKTLGATVVNMRFVKPLDTSIIKQLAENHQLLVTVEENAVAGGAGSAVNEYLATQGIIRPVLNLGLPDQFIEHGVHGEMLSDCGLDAQKICDAVEKRLHTITTMDELIL